MQNQKVMKYFEKDYHYHEVKITNLKQGDVIINDNGSIAVVTSEVYDMGDGMFGYDERPFCSHSDVDRYLRSKIRR